MRAILRDAIGAILLLVFLELFEHLVLPHIPFVATWVPTVDSDSDAITTLFDTLAQIAGVFIGLYFAAISTITSGPSGFVVGEAG